MDDPLDVAPSIASRTTLGLGIAGSLLMWAALPPCSLGPIGWVAPVPWLLLIRRPKLAGRRPYAELWVAGLLFWLLAIHWIRLPHPATSIGWVAMSCCLALYVPLFVSLSRHAVHAFGVSVLVAAPVVWTGLELARAHLLTGFLMAALGHTQVRWIEVIQISDLGGAYAVSFVVMWVAACIARVVPCRSDDRVTVWPLAAALAVLAATLGYGHLRIRGESTRTGPRVGIVQGAIDADWKRDPSRTRKIFDAYLELSEEAVKRSGGQLDLVVWPETMFPQPLLVVDPVDPPAAGADDLPGRRIRGRTPETIAAVARRLGTPLLLGISAFEYSASGTRRLNSAVATDAEGRITGRYDKMHLVMFGEYVPLARWLPWLYRLTPLDGGLSPGVRPEALTIGRFRYAPNICFETVLPQTIRSQVTSLIRAGREPDVLVNLTNDGWFWGSSELDMHLACSVFRAVECRKPMLVAANSGISASIDASGRVVRRGPKRATDVILADVTLDDRTSPYLRLGDWSAGLCLSACGAIAVAAGIAAVGRRP